MAAFEERIANMVDARLQAFEERLDKKLEKFMEEMRNGFAAAEERLDKKLDDFKAEMRRDYPPQHGSQQ